MAAMLDYSVKNGNKISSGKVREIFDIDGDHLIMVTTDRLSAFDVVMPNPIPDKGTVLNSISLWWFDKTSSIIRNHLVSADINLYPEPFKGDERLKNRSMLVVKAKPLSIECIVRGYISGSGWKEYKAKGSICGIMLPEGLKESEKLPGPIFTPSTKAEMGHHDENVSEEIAEGLVGRDIFEIVKQKSIDIYKMASEEALKKGIIIADTKFEFGIRNGEVILIDEVLTPDSSRFWPLDKYEPGKPQPSFDKQFVRDYLETLDWGKKAPGPKLPEEVINKTREKYIEAYERLTGLKFG